MAREIAKPAALQQLKDRVGLEEGNMNDKWRRSFLDQASAMKSAKLYKKSLDRVIPETLSGAVKDTMWKKAKALKDEFVVGMLSREESHPVKGFMKDGKMVWVVDEAKMQDMRSVERNTAWNQKNDAKVREYKNLMRHLCPDDPNAGDIERFRPKKRGIN